MLRQVLSQRQSVGQTYVTKIASDTVEAGSTRLKIKATAHAAQVGDIISITARGHVGVEARVVSIETDYIGLNQMLPLTVGAGDTFDILRLGTTPPGVNVLSSLVPYAYDAVVLGYTGDNLTSVVFKSGGLAGTTVATLTLAYTGSRLDSVERS